MALLARASLIQHRDANPADTNKTKRKRGRELKRTYCVSTQRLDSVCSRLDGATNRVGPEHLNMALFKCKYLSFRCGNVAINDPHTKLNSVRPCIMNPNLLFDLVSSLFLKPVCRTHSKMCCRQCAMLCLCLRQYGCASPS